MGENSAATPKAISNILREVSMIDDFSMKSTRLDFYANLLQEEMRKIDAFKRELPQCMYIVQDVIELLKQESLKWQKKHTESAIREQFQPLKKNAFFENGGVKSSDESDEKKNWLASAQLWSTTHEYENPDSGSVFQKYHQGEGSGIGRHGQGCGIGWHGQGSSFQSKGTTFVPFKRSPNVGIQMKEKKASPPPVPVLVDGLSFSFNDVEPIELNKSNAKNDFSSVVSAQELHEMYPAEDQHQNKKQRRCWSPELHKLFVNALNQLGGHKSATPKMIREIMQVDGLTNDEVKSHLQKYRLHVKKYPSSSAGPSKLPSWLNTNQHVDLNTAGSSGSSKSPFHNGLGPMRLDSGTAGKSMDGDAESHGWMPWIPRSSAKRT